MKGYTYLKYGLDGYLEPKTIIRTEHISEYEGFDETKDYDYYIFENDNMFHRCNKDGRLGAKYQDRFLNYKVLNKKFEMYCVLKEPQEHKKPEKLPYYSLEKIQKAKNKDEWREERISLLEKRIDDYHNKINEIIDYMEEIK